MTDLNDSSSPKLWEPPPTQISALRPGHWYLLAYDPVQSGIDYDKLAKLTGQDFRTRDYKAYPDGMVSFAYHAGAPVTPPEIEGFKLHAVYPTDIPPEPVFWPGTEYEFRAKLVAPIDVEEIAKRYESEGMQIGLTRDPDTNVIQGKLQVPVPLSERVVMGRELELIESSPPPMPDIDDSLATTGKKKSHLGWWIFGGGAVALTSYLLLRKK